MLRGKLMNKKRLILVLTLVGLLFLMSGCTIPTDDSGNIIFITNDTTFESIMNSEGLFSAIFVFPLAKLINWLTPLTNVVVAIILVTILVNALALLLTFRSSMESLKLQLIQPELTRIQKKYEGKDDQTSRMRPAQEMQNVYKKHDIKPFRTILTKFIQYPSLFASYYAVRRSSGFQTGQYAYVVIFALMIVAQIVAMKTPMFLQEQKLRRESEIHHRRYEKPENPMGGMMYAMVIFIGILMISWPSAMSLYYLISSLVMIAKTLLVNKLTEKTMNKKA